MTSTDACGLVGHYGEAAATRCRRVPSLVGALTTGVIAAMAIGGLCGSLGYRVLQSQAEQQREALFLHTGRQAAVDLTTIAADDAESAVERILDSATAAFYDDFQRRAPQFVDAVKQARSRSEGTVIEAGIESANAHEAQVLVAVAAKTVIESASEEPPRGWRLRIGLQMVGGAAKVADVQFVS